MCLVEDRCQVSDIAEHVGRDVQVDTRGGHADHRVDEIRHEDRIVNSALSRMLDDSGRDVDADQQSGEWSQFGPAQAGTAAQVDHRPFGARAAGRTLDGVRQDLVAAIRQPIDEELVESVGAAVEQLDHFTAKRRSESLATNRSQQVVTCGQVGVELRDSPKTFARGHSLATSSVQGTLREQRRNMIGIDLERLLARSDRFVERVSALQRKRSPVKCIAVLGTRAQNGVEREDGIVKLPPLE